MGWTKGATGRRKGSRGKGARIKAARKSGKRESYKKGENREPRNGKLGDVGKCHKKKKKKYVSQDES